MSLTTEHLRPYPRIDGNASTFTVSQRVRETMKATRPADELRPRWVARPRGRHKLSSRTDQPLAVSAHVARRVEVAARVIRLGETPELQRRGIAGRVPIGASGSLGQTGTGAPATAFIVAHVGAAGAEALGPQFVNQLKSGSSGGVHPVCSDTTRHGSGLSKSALSSAQAGTLGHSVRNAVAWGLEREKSPAFDG